MKVDLQKLKDRRQVLGYTQVQLTKGICGASHYSQFERGLAPLARESIEKICERLDLPLSEILLDGLFDPPRKPKWFSRNELRLLAGEIQEAVQQEEDLEQIAKRLLECLKERRLISDARYNRLLKQELLNETLWRCDSMATIQVKVPPHLLQDRYWRGMLHLMQNHDKLQTLLTPKYFDLEKGTIRFIAMKKLARPWSSSERTMLDLAAHLYNPRNKFDMAEFHNLDKHNFELAITAIKMRYA